MNRAAALKGIVGCNLTWETNEREIAETKQCIELLNRESANVERELVTIKGQRDIIREEMDVARSQYRTVAQAYVTVMAGKVVKAAPNPKLWKFNQAAFDVAVVARYEAALTTENGDKYRWCHILGE